MACLKKAAVKPRMAKREMMGRTRIMVKDDDVLAVVDRLGLGRRMCFYGRRTI